MSRAQIIWQSRQNELLVAQSFWQPRLAGFFKSVAITAYATYGATEDIEATLFGVGTALSNPLIHHLSTLYFDNGTRFIKRRGEQIKGDTPSEVPGLTTYSTRMVVERANGVAGSILLGLRTLITAARERGDSRSAIMNAVLDYPGLNERRAGNVVHSELLTSANAATHFSMKLEAGTIRKQWHVHDGGGVRSTHADVGSAIIPHEQPFQVNGYAMQFPGDSLQGAPVSEFVACRCIVLYYLG